MTNVLKAKVCNVLTKGSGGPVIILGTFSGQKDNVREVFDETSKLTDLPFTLAAFETQNWNYELSPWPAEGMQQGSPFEGGGPLTLAWIRENVLPFLKENFGDVPVYLAGYSLAGLFALWGYCEMPEISGCICCSGSLWFPEWMEYAQKHGLNGPIYLSLGGKEEKTNHPVVQKIGDLTRQTDKIIQGPHKLEWNSGGHFGNSAKRLAKGIAWMLKE